MESKIKSGELRIGNLVQMNGIYISVTHILPLWIEGDYSPFGYIEYDKLEPIELTEQVILKCGYKQVNTLNNGTLVFSGTPYLYFKDGVVRFLCHTIKIQFLHQLQNVVFYHQGKELEFKA